MAAGLLQVDGVIFLGQFWPKGRAQADATTIRVDVSNSTFRFQEHAGAAFRASHALDGSVVRGHYTRPCVDKGTIAVRLQGIDAPELHYRPTGRGLERDRSPGQRARRLKGSLSFRQGLSHLAVAELARLLGGSGRAGALPCLVKSAVDSPSDAFDTYGRLVGDIFVHIAERQVRVNDWLLERGWAFPAFYASMSAEEISRQIALADSAWRHRRGVWPFLSDFARPADFDWTMVYRNPLPGAGTDAESPIVLPKLFRRLCAYSVHKKAGISTGSFDAYLRKQGDQCHLTEEF